MIEIREVVDEPDVRAFHEVLMGAAGEGRDHPLLVSADAMVASVADPSPQRRRLLLAAYDGDRMVGALLSDRNLDNNLHQADIEIGVAADRRREGIGTALWDRAISDLSADGRSTLLTEINVPSGVSLDEHPVVAFFSARGFTSVHTEDRCILAVPLPEQRREALDAGASTDAYDVITWSGPCPEEHVEAFAAMRSAMNADVPMGEIDWEPEVVTADDVRRNGARMQAQGFVTITSVARDLSDGTLAAYSQLLVQTSEPADVFQDDTFVLRAHRGHRLGTLIKLANLSELAAHHPEAQRVQTWTDPDNTAMRRTNDDFGFVVTERMHEFQRVG